MIKIGDITECLRSISPYSEEELLQYEVLLEAERAEVEQRLKETGSHNLNSAVLLAAARVNYKLALIKESSDRVTSFKAGDVSFTEGSEALSSAKALLEEVCSGCAELVGKDGFAFKTV